MQTSQIPQLDGPPPAASPAAGPPSATYGGLAPADPAMEAGGDLQVTQLLLQTAQAVAQGLDILGKMNPSLAGLSAQMTSMLREGVKSALQQGSAAPESNPMSFAQMGNPGMA